MLTLRLIGDVMSAWLVSLQDGAHIYVTDSRGQQFRERLKYAGVAETTTLRCVANDESERLVRAVASREILVHVLDKYELHVDACNICLKSAPTLPLSLDQPVKHLLLDDLVVTGMSKSASDITSFRFSSSSSSNYDSSCLCFFFLSFFPSLEKSLGAYTRNTLTYSVRDATFGKTLSVPMLPLFIEA